MAANAMESSNVRSGYCRHVFGDTELCIPERYVGVEPRGVGAQGVVCKLKTSRRINRNSVKQSARINDSPFSKNENKRISEKNNYTNVNTKTRPKTNRSKPIHSCRSLKTHSVRDHIKSNLDSQNSKLKTKYNRKLDVDNIQNKIEVKQCRKQEVQEVKAKRDIVAENIATQGKRLYPTRVRRISATNNFVYEFNPSTDVRQSKPLISCTNLHSRSYHNEKIVYARTDTVNKKRSAILPDLNSHLNFVTNNSNSNITNLTKDTYLPTLNKVDSKILCKQAGDRYKQKSHDARHIDGQVRPEKSNLQLLRAEGDLINKKKYNINNQTNKLYEILEKVTHEIDRIRKTYKDTHGDRYLHKNANDVLNETNAVNLKEDNEVAKSIILEKKKSKIKSENILLKNADTNIIYKDKSRTDFDQILPKYGAKKRFIYTNTDVNNIDDIRIAKSASEIYDKNMKLPIREYMQKYSEHINKSRDIEKEKTEKQFQTFETSANDIANILADLNISPLYDNFRNDENDTLDMKYRADEEDEKYSVSNATTNTAEAIFTNIMEKKVHNNTIAKNTELERDVELMKAIDAKSFDTSSQANIATSMDNTFIKIGLDILNKNLSRDKLSQILQSEYLRKDLSL